MSQWNDPGKPEEAMKAVVDGLTLNIYTGDGDVSAVTVNTGQEDDDLALPSVTCAVIGASGEEVVKGTGIHRCRAVVRVTSSANVAKDEHQARAATVFDALLSSTIKETLSASISDFHVFEFSYQSPEPTRRDPRGDGDETFVYVTELPLELVWCGSTIS